MPGRKYVKIFVDIWFAGYMRRELSSEERGIFVDLLVMAGMSLEPGKILINKGVGYPPEVLAKALNVSVRALNSTIEKLKKPHKNEDGTEDPPEISVDKAGVITLRKWRSYQSNWDKVKDSDSQQFKDSSKIPPETKKIFAYYKKKIQPNSRPLEKHMRKIAARLRTYSVDDLKIAIDRFAASDWWMKNNGWRGASWFFGSDDRVEKSMNIQPQEGNRARQQVDKRD